MQERRAKRKIFEYVCTLDYRDGREPRPCQVTDISTGGAKLEIMFGTDGIPDEVTLILSANGAVRRACVVAWRSPSAIGVKFI